MRTPDVAEAEPPPHTAPTPTQASCPLNSLRTAAVAVAVLLLCCCYCCVVARTPRGSSDIVHFYIILIVIDSRHEEWRHLW
jgi:hypothetical protein